jgi:hypothetical protein
MKIEASAAINQNFDTAGDRLSERLVSRGFGKSGQTGRGLREIEVGRQGALASNESRFKAMEMDEINKIIQQAMQFSFANPGNNQTATQPGNMLGGGLSGGLETATTLFMLDKILGGGGGGLGNV